MFFLASKILGVLVPPSNFLLFMVLCATAALYSRFARIGRIVLIAAILGVFACGFGPVGAILLRPLEDRFVRPPADMQAPTGIIVLGGGIDADISDARQSIALTEGGGRVAEAAALALRYPKALLVFSGGSADVFVGGKDEAGPAQRFFASVGVDAQRILLERRSRNTFENAEFTRDLVKPRPGQRWLLVTSAAHMPRAVGVFRRVGFPVVAFPTSYRTSGRSSDFWTAQSDVSAGLSLTDTAIHEWVGLFAYRFTDKIDAVLPGPQN